MSRKKWIVSGCDKDAAAEIAESCGIEPFAALLMCARGMTDEFEAESFLYDTDMCDPFSLPDMETAVERIKKALGDGEKITVFGDYDADGVTSTALMYQYLLSQGANVDYYIPDRADEGYGMSIGAVDVLCERGTKLIVTVDNGISAWDEINHAKKLGIDVVVTDHHRVGEALPEAVAVVDPHREDSAADFSDWAGVGVAFKLICALSDGDCDELLVKYGDLVALGTVADIVTLHGENRVLVRSGVAIMNAEYFDGTLREGLIALIEESAGSGKPINSAGLAFRIAPRINAAGRMGSAERALKLLLTADRKEAASLAKEISEANALRQRTESEITAAAIEQIEKNPDIKFKRVLVVSGESWHQGVIGIVASRIAECYGKPCIVISREGTSARGSGRSIEGFSLYDALKYCADTLTQYGGHTLAAGMSLNAADIDLFREKINEYAEQTEAPVPVLKLDCKLNPASINIDMLSALSILEPFGAGNPQPLFGLYNMTITAIQPMGGGKHLRINVSRGGASLTVVLFSVTPEEFPYKASDVVDLAVRLSQNEYMGDIKVSIQVKDIKLSAMKDDGVAVSERAYEAFMGGASTAEVIERVSVDRAFCGNIYKYIKSNNGWSFDCEMLSYRLGLNEESIAKCKVALDVLSEIGVLVPNGGKYTLPAEQKKAVLENSSVFKRISAEGQI